MEKSKHSAIITDVVKMSAGVACHGLPDIAEIAAQPNMQEPFDGRCPKGPPGDPGVSSSQMLQIVYNDMERWQDRALKAEAELRRCYKDMEELTAERNDLKTMLADAGVRNAVLEKRLNYTTELLAQLGNCPSVEPVQGCINVPCGVCWHEWLEQEVQA